MERSAEMAERTAEVFRGSHGAAFVQFANDYLRTTPEGFTRSSEEISRILQGRSDEDRQLAYDAADVFAARHLGPLEEPTLLGANREALGEPRSAASIPEAEAREAGRSPAGNPRGHHASGPEGSLEQNARDGAERLGIRAPSAERELRPDQELSAVQSGLGDDVTSHLSREVKKVPKR